MQLPDNIRFLIVDDDQYLAKSLEEGLTLLDNNYYAKSLHFQGNLQELMEQVHIGEYDIVILDIVMPQISGREITKKLRSEGYNMPIILMTGVQHAFAGGRIDESRSRRFTP